MASAVAHSIRNPLASIRSSAEVALTGESLPSFQNAAKDIMSEVDRVENWIRNLLAYSQPLKNNSMPVKINDVIREALLSFEKEMERRGVKLILDLRDPLPVIGGDFTLLGQMFNSLIANAIQAMPMEGKLNFISRASEDQNQIEVKIIDTGHGIPNDQIEKVFRPFFTMKEKGLGVGLYLAKRIVERHCGTIDLSSVEGQGTTFCLEFPVLK
jgi:signal transduction histidine kinase